MKIEINKELGVSIPLSYKELLELGGVINLHHIKSKDFILLTCGYCKKTMKKIKSYTYTCFKKHTPLSKNFFCSKECQKKYIYGENCLPKIVTCIYCGKKFKKYNGEIKQTNNNFCSRSCAGFYNNAHKTKGTRISKLEFYLQKKLLELYPSIFFSFNNIEAINAELDIFIPELKLAFELNGIFHYEPIYGLNKLNSIQKNDINKFQKCIEKEISLCIIDTSQQKYFKEETSQKYLKIITEIINKKRKPE